MNDIAQNLRMRRDALCAVRAHFDAHGYLEISTRQLRKTTATDPYIESFRICDNHGNMLGYLQTSPEYAHKILLGNHPELHAIYEVARVFRDEPAGLIHSPEFTLVEWYRRGSDAAGMMEETEALIRDVSRALGVSHWQSSCRFGAPISIDISQPFERLTFNDAFIRYAGFSLEGLDKEGIFQKARALGCRVHPEWSCNDILNCVLVDKIEPHLGTARPTFLTDYPASMAALARVRTNPAGVGLAHVAERFELYLCGIELCNGYSELTDSGELRKRFYEDNAQRQSLGLSALPIDEDLLEALPHLGTVGGNALGFERLLMVCMGYGSIEEALCRI